MLLCWSNSVDLKPSLFILYGRNEVSSHCWYSLTSIALCDAKDLLSTMDTCIRDGTSIQSLFYACWTTPCEGAFTEEVGVYPLLQQGISPVAEKCQAGVLGSFLNTPNDVTSATLVLHKTSSSTFSHREKNEETMLFPRSTRDGRTAPAWHFSIDFWRTLNRTVYNSRYSSKWWVFETFWRRWSIIRAQSVFRNGILDKLTTGKNFGRLNSLHWIFRSWNAHAKTIYARLAPDIWKFLYESPIPQVPQSPKNWFSAILQKISRNPQNLKF